jgi:hypothetical protein
LSSTCCDVTVTLVTGPVGAKDPLGDYCLQPDTWEGEPYYKRADGAYYIYFFSLSGFYVIHNVLEAIPDPMWYADNPGAIVQQTYSPNGALPDPPSAVVEVGECPAQLLGFQHPHEMGALQITSDGADPDPAGTYIPVGWHDGQLYYQSQDNVNWYLVFYDYEKPEWSLQQLGPLTYPGDVWPSPNGWYFRSEELAPRAAAGEYVPRGTARGKIEIRAL